MSTKYNKSDNQSNKVSKRYSINNVKINPFGILNDNNNNDNDNNISIINSNINTSNAKLYELIKKYESKNYLLPAQRKLVEEELAKRNMKVNKVDFPSLNNTKSNNENFPILNNPNNSSNSKSENTPVKFTEQTFKDIITNIVKRPEPILINVKPKSETIKTDECLLGIPDTIDIEENKNLNLKLSDNRVNTQTVDFIKNLCNNRKQTYNERKLYKEYLRDTVYQKYTTSMTFDEWCEFKNDILHQERIELKRERDKYGILSSSDEDKFDDDYNNVEDIETYEDDEEYNNDEY